METEHTIKLENGIELVVYSELYQQLTGLSAYANMSIEEYVQSFIKNYMKKEVENAQIIVLDLYEFCLNVCRKREKVQDSLNEY